MSAAGENRTIFTAESCQKVSSPASPTHAISNICLLMILGMFSFPAEGVYQLYGLFVPVTYILQRFGRSTWNCYSWNVASFEVHETQKMKNDLAEFCRGGMSLFLRFGCFSTPTVHIKSM